METVKLYYENAFLREFDGVVVDCRPQGKKWLVQLDRTAFYPEGGGQPADHGILGGAKVTDVHERDGVILHTCDRAQSVIFCGQFNTCPSVPLPTPAFALV